MSKIEHISSYGIINEPNKKLGYYLVNDEIYYNKFHALIDATKTNSQVRWFFNEDAFVKFPWHVEPEESLRELYRQRAQQLRDRYDYLRIEASGGSDSTTAVYSFLLNNIHLDEVVFRYPKLGEKGASGDPSDTRCENTLSEWEYAAKPLLNWIATNYPATKITVHDYSEDMVKKAETEDESWIFKTRHYLQPAHASKHATVDLVEHRLTADRDLKIGIIYGVDKPKLFIKDDKFFIYFSDSFANHNNGNVEDYTNISNEFFYWDPDCCKLLAKQAHTIKNWVSMPENSRMQSVFQWPNNDFSARSMYEQLVKYIIYPDYDFHTFQTVKPSNNIWNEMDFWFHANFKDTKMYNVWESGINYLIDNIDDQYVTSLNGRVSNIQIFDSIYYCLGESTIPKTTSPVNTKDLLSVHKASTVDRLHRHVIDGRIVVY
jgi:hypothetical protein